MIWHVGRNIREAGSGPILITSSTASQTLGPCRPAYFASRPHWRASANLSERKNRKLAFRYLFFFQVQLQPNLLSELVPWTKSAVVGPMDEAAEVARVGI